MSIFEVKYMVMNHEARKKVCVRYFLNKLLLKQVIKKIEMFVDNKTSLIQTKNPESQNCTEHTNVIYHQMQGLVKEIKLKIK